MTNPNANVDKLAFLVSAALDAWFARDEHSQYDGPSESEIARFLDANGVVAPPAETLLGMPLLVNPDMKSNEVNFGGVRFVVGEEGDGA